MPTTRTSSAPEAPSRASKTKHSRSAARTAGATAAARDERAFDVADGEIARDAVLAEPQQTAAYLQEHLGQQLTAYLAGLQDVRMVGKWAREQAHPPALTRERLRVAYQATRLFALRYSDQAAQGWFFGANSALDQRAPATVLREARSPDELALVVPLVRAFMRGAH